MQRGWGGQDTALHSTYIGKYFVVLPDAERGYGHPGKNHVHGSAAGLVHQQEGEISVRDPLKQRQHLMPHKKQL